MKPYEFKRFFHPRLGKFEYICIKDSSIGVGGTRAFLKNDLIPTQLHTTFHLMATNFRSRIFWSRIFSNLYVFPYFVILFLISYFVVLYLTKAE